VHKPSHFPAPTESFDGQTLTWPMRLNDQRIVGIETRAAGRAGLDCVAYADPDSGITAEDESFLSAEIRHRLALDTDLRDFDHVTAEDNQLGEVFTRWRGMRPSCLFSLYELLCITVCLQNAQVDRSVKMLQALLENYGHRVDIGGTELFAFWTPAALLTVPEDELRALKVGYRAKTFLLVSQDFAAHPQLETQLRAMSKADAHKAIQRIYGVGPASAWYLLFESLKHLDAFDYVSPWERKILARLIYNQDDIEPGTLLTEATQRWGEFRMLAVHYVFEDLFWQRKHGTGPAWLEELIRL
jgi:3-methyladenine DNA glycosylase/8-oxoguanine DNA glycosylase